MPSATSLRGRVARVAALAAAAGALVAALSASLLGERLILAGEDTRLIDALRSFEHELASDSGRAGAIADEEANEIAQSGLRIALFEGGRLLGGDRSVPYGEDGCATDGGHRHCALSLPGQRRIMVIAPEDPRAPFRRSFWLAAAIAVLLAASGGALVSWRAAGWAVRPLTALRAQLAKVGPDGHGHQALESPIECSEVDALRTALADALIRLDAALAHARRFAADAAHELRTPLTTVIAELDLLAESSASEAALARARATLASVSQLLGQLLLLAAPPESVELRDAVSLAEVTGEAAAALGPRVSLTLDGEGMVRGDASLLRVLVDNVIDNALKFSGSAPVTVALRETGGAVQLEVTDSGPGVPPAERARVFDPFFRTAKARAEVAGSGVGLALVAHIAALHGGSAAFADVERGACLRVTLPAWSARG